MLSFDHQNKKLGEIQPEERQGILNFTLYK